MIENVLSQKLRPLIEAEKTLRRRRVLSSVLGLGALAAGALLALAASGVWWSWPVVLGLAAAVVIACLAGGWTADRRGVEIKSLARRIETAHPDLQAALLTAVEQKPDATGELGYLQERVVFQAVNHALQHNWVRQVSSRRLVGAGFLQLAMLLSFTAVMLALLGEMTRQGRLLAEAAETDPDSPLTDPLAPYEIAVNPGDTEVERGSRLIVEAKFGEARIPPEATLSLREPAGDGPELGRVPLRPGLDESVFAGILTKVDRDAVYRIEFDGDRSDEYRITTYVHPALETADATITPPEYTRQAPKTIADTRKVSLLEGSDLSWSMKINKPVTAAELYGEDETILPLAASEADPTVLVATHRPEKSQRYRLHLVDEKDRANKQPPWFTVNVKKNLPPQLDFVFPKRDIQVSALQELPVEATVWDDLGVIKAGASFSFGDETREIDLAPAVLKGGEKHPLQTLFAVEDIGARPRDLVAYHLWAEDIGPEGRPRRTQSDMFFAEVRHFEDIFREQENMGGQPGEGRQGQAQKLLDLQKEIMNATWKLIRRHEMGAAFPELSDDTGVVRDSQNIAIDRTHETIGQVEDPALGALLETAAEQMGQAAAELARTIDSQDGELLRAAHSAERKAYESLIKARSQEHNVTRAQDSSSGSGGPQQEQMMELEMKQKELRYEQESQAQDPEQTAEQQENLAVLNRLKELARRQEAIAQKIKELETALQEADTEEKRNELERQLKRLQEEQEQLLRELDELTQRMDKDENRANMAQEREQLEKTRDKVQETSEKLGGGKLADAANAATRAQRELEEVKEDFRKKTSRRFDEEMRAVRKAARDLAEKQEAIGEKYEESGVPDRGDPFDMANSPVKNAELSREIETQRNALDEMLEQMRQLSEDSEVSEPLLSTSLYEALRDAKMSGIDESLAEARDLTRFNRRQEAQESERTAARGIEDLKSDVEKAAEKVLGSEADALRVARSELDNLIENARKESERLDGEKPGESDKAGQSAKNDRTQQGQVPDSTGSSPGEQGNPEGPQPGKPGEKPDPEQQPGEKGQKSPQIAGAEGKGESEGKGQPGERGYRGGFAEGGNAPSPNDQMPGAGGSRQSSFGGPNWGRGEDQRGPQAPSPSLAEAGKPLFFQGAKEAEPEGPITGGDYEKWSDRLRNIESMVEQDDIRNELAKVLDNARAMRIEFKRNNFAPQAATLDQRITDPLVEIRGRVSEEIAKLDKDNPLAPIDRDPVPQEFRELVRKYYEELGSGQ